MNQTIFFAVAEFGFYITLLVGVEVIEVNVLKIEKCYKTDIPHIDLYVFEVVEFEFHVVLFAGVGAMKEDGLIIEKIFQIDISHVKLYVSEVAELEFYVNFLWECQEVDGLRIENFF